MSNKMKGKRNMKKLIAIFIVLSSLLLASCNSDVQEPTDIPTEPQESESVLNKPTEEPTEEPTERPTEEVVRGIECLLEIDGVISVEPIEFEMDIDFAEAYRVMFESEGHKIAADFVLPKDYSGTKKDSPVIFYYPSAKLILETVAVNYAKNGISVVRLWARGFGSSEGVRDFGGEDIADAKKLIEICSNADFMKNSSFFLAGAAEGSITAMRIAAEDESGRIKGCAVSEVISDLALYAEARGEQVKNLIASAVGGSAEELPEEYKKRSAVNFFDRLTCPMLILHYSQSPFCVEDQSNMLNSLISTHNSKCYYAKLDILTSDFAGQPMQYLIAFVLENK